MGMQIIPSMTSSDILNLLEQVGVRSATQITVEFYSRRERLPDKNAETGKWVEHLIEETYRLSGANIPKIFELNDQLKYAKSIYVVWNDDDEFKIRSLSINETKTVITLQGFTNMPFNFEGISVRPQEVVLRF